MPRRPRGLTGGLAPKAGRYPSGTVPATSLVHPRTGWHAQAAVFDDGQVQAFKGYEPPNFLSGQGRLLLAAVLNQGVLGSTGPLPAPENTCGTWRGGREAPGGRRGNKRSRLYRHYCLNTSRRKLKRTKALTEGHDTAWQQRPRPGLCGPHASPVTAEQSLCKEAPHSRWGSGAGRAARVPPAVSPPASDHLPASRGARGPFSIKLHKPEKLTSGRKV